MASRNFLAASLAVIGALSFGGWLIGTVGDVRRQPTNAVQADDNAKRPDVVVTLLAEVERLKKVVPDQSHAMKDVDYHFTNLWFAGQARNWPLADFYWKETVSHLRWAVRIIPIRKDNAGQEIKLEPILESIEHSPFMQMGDVIKKQNPDEFDKTYRYIMEGCYSCHKAADKPYLRPQIPAKPATMMINFDPAATWPK